MKTVKTILPVAIVALFLTLAIAPSVSADEPSQDQVLEIGYKDANGYQFYKKITVTAEQLQQFNTDWTAWENKVDEINNDEMMDATEVLEFETMTTTLIEEIKALTYDPETGTYNFPEPLTIGEFIHNYLFMQNILGKRIFSIGRGRAWLPLNRQGESFIGMRFLPIIIQHSIGFTKVRLVNFFPPSIGVEDRMFTHNLMTMGFTGLYINFGERYLDRPAGPVILIGKTMFVRLGEDIP